MQLTSPEELELLMMVAGSEDPLETALTVRRRWRYLLAVARTAQRGEVMDRSLPQVVADCDRFAARAESMVAALDQYVEHLIGNRNRTL